MAKRVSDMSPEEYRIHRERSNGYHRKFRMKNPGLDREYQKKNPEIIKRIVDRYQTKYYRKLKIDAMNAYGGQCTFIDKNGIQCSKNSNENLVDLTIDHSRGDGDKHRQEIFGDPNKAGWHFYLWLRNNDFPQDLGLRVLCREHHQGQGRKKLQGRLNDPVWLKKQYVDNKMTLQEISEECEGSLWTVENRLKEFGMIRRGKKIS